MSGGQASLIGFGAAVGLGLFLLLRAALVTEQPQLSDALARLDGREMTGPVRAVPEEGIGGREPPGEPGRGPAPGFPALRRRATRWS